MFMPDPAEATDHQAIDHGPTVLGDDGVLRPLWADRSPAARAYFDREWNVPVHDGRGLFELVALLVLAGGLSWSTVIGRREALRSAFHGFDPESVAAFTDGDVAAVLADDRVIRNRRKVEAVRTNARAACGLRGGGGLATLVHGYDGATPAGADAEVGAVPVDLSCMPRRSDRSARLAADLASAGFVHLGPVAAQALLLASGAIRVERPGSAQRSSKDVEARADRGTKLRKRCA